MLELTEDFSALVDGALDEMKEELGDDAEIIKNGFKDSIKDILSQLKDGKSIEEIIKDADAKTTAMASAALFKLAKHQTKALNSFEKILKGMVGIILRQVVARLTGVL